MKCKQLVNEVMKLVNKCSDIKIVFSGKIKLVSEM